MALELLLLLAMGIVALIIFFTLPTSTSNSTESKKGSKLLPGPSGWPLIGHTVSFMTPHPSIVFGEFLDKCIARFGKVFRISLLAKPTVISSDPEFNRMILQSEGRLFEANYPTSVIHIMGEWTMLKVVGDLHKEMRNLTINFMSFAKLKTYFLPDVERQALNILNSWKENSVFSAHEEGKKFAFRLMVKHLMDLDEEMPETHRLAAEYFTFMKGMASIPLNLPGTAYRKAVQSRHVIIKIMGDKLDETKKRLNEEGEEMKRGDFLTFVSRHTTLTRDQILDLLLGMLFAGHETTSAAIALAIYFLHNCPKALKQLIEEHIEIAKRKKERHETGLNWDDYKQMEFTTCVINETLRLGNIVKFVHRKTIKDVEYKGFKIPSGWEVVPLLSAAHLDPSVYDDPHTYNPWRWQSSASNLTRSLMPFSGGPRLCPGADLAKLEMAIFLHHLVLNYEWELLEKDYPVALPFLGFTKGLPMKVRRIVNNNI